MAAPTSKKNKSQLLPKRKDVPLADQWDLTPLFPSDAAWEKAFNAWEAEIPTFATFKGKLSRSAKTLAQLFQFDGDFDRRGERLGNYASLQATGDNGDSIYQRMKGRFHHVAVKAGEAASFIRPGAFADSEAEDGQISEGEGTRPVEACRSNGSSAIARTRGRIMRSNCSPCPGRCRMVPTRFSGSSMIPI